MPSPPSPPTHGNAWAEASPLQNRVDEIRAKGNPPLRRTGRGGKEHERPTSTTRNPPNPPPQTIPLHAWSVHGAHSTGSTGGQHEAGKAHLLISVEGTGCIVSLARNPATATRKVCGWREETPPTYPNGNISNDAPRGHPRETRPTPPKQSTPPLPSVLPFRHYERKTSTRPGSPGDWRREADRAGHCLEVGRAGAHVIVNYNQSREGAMATVREIAALGVRAEALRAEVSRPRQVAAMFRAIEKRLAAGSARQ